MMLTGFAGHNQEDNIFLRGRHVVMAHLLNIGKIAENAKIIRECVVSNCDRDKHFRMGKKGKIIQRSRYCARHLTKARGRIIQIGLVLKHRGLDRWMRDIVLRQSFEAIVVPTKCLECDNAQNHASLYCNDHQICQNCDINRRRGGSRYCGACANTNHEKRMIKMNPMCPNCPNHQRATGRAGCHHCLRKPR